MTTTHRPLIGLTTYRKTAAQSTPVALYALMPSYVCLLYTSRCV